MEFSEWCFQGLLLDFRTPNPQKRVRYLKRLGHRWNQVRRRCSGVLKDRLLNTKHKRWKMLSDNA